MDQGNCADTKHCFEIWHNARSTTKELLASSEEKKIKKGCEKGCEIVIDWMKGICGHVFPGVRYQPKVVLGPSFLQSGFLLWVMSLQQAC